LPSLGEASWLLQKRATRRARRQMRLYATGRWRALAAALLFCEGGRVWGSSASICSAVDVRLVVPMHRALAERPRVFPEGHATLATRNPQRSRWSGATRCEDDSTGRSEAVASPSCWREATALIRGRYLMLQLYPMDSMCSVPEYPKAAKRPGASFAVDGLARQSKITVERRAHLSTSFGALPVLASPPAQLVLLLCCAPWQAAAPAAASSLLLGSANAVADSAAGAATAALRTCASSGDRAQCGLVRATAADALLADGAASAASRVHYACGALARRLARCMFATQLVGGACARRLARARSMRACCVARLWRSRWVALSMFACLRSAACSMLACRAACLRRSRVAARWRRVAARPACDTGAQGSSAR
jgi:hypothetical protein